MILNLGLQIIEIFYYYYSLVLRLLSSVYKLIYVNNYLILFSLFLVYYNRK